MRHAQLQAKEREVAVLAERNRIARDLHDAVSQTLFASTVLAGTLARAAGRGNAPGSAATRKQALALERLNRGALAEMRLLMVELRPDALEQAPLADLLQLAIEALSCRGEIRVEATLARDDPLPPSARIQVYRIAQEALSNIGKHSGATQAVVQWQVDGERASLRIADDGRGFDPGDSRPGHFGLDNMRARALEIGARLTITSAPGEGAELKVELP
jgi:signal transduction histidine kinase